jgi:hypothetical protein
VIQLGTHKQRMLLRRDQVLDELQIDEEQFEDFIKSNLITEVQIRGHRRFDSDEVDLAKLSLSISRNSHRNQTRLRSARHAR